MSLSFLSKKSWHTTNLKNVEAVWIAERAEEAEAVKMEAWKKDREVRLMALPNARLLRPAGLGSMMLVRARVAGGTADPGTKAASA